MCSVASHSSGTPGTPGNRLASSLNRIRRSADHGQRQGFGMCSEAAPTKWLGGDMNTITSFAFRRRFSERTPRSAFVYILKAEQSSKGEQGWQAVRILLK
jgi:hypothetical protein